MNAKRVLEKYIEVNFSDEEAGELSEDEITKEFDSNDECELSEDEDDMDKVKTIQNIISESDALISSLRNFSPQQTSKEQHSTSSIPSSSSTFLLMEPMSRLIDSLSNTTDAIESSANQLFVDVNECVEAVAYGAADLNNSFTPQFSELNLSATNSPSVLLNSPNQTISHSSSRTSSSSITIIRRNRYSPIGRKA